MLSEDDSLTRVRTFGETSGDDEVDADASLETGDEENDDETVDEEFEASEFGGGEFCCFTSAS